MPKTKGWFSVEKRRLPSFYEKLMDMDFGDSSIVFNQYINAELMYYYFKGEEMPHRRHLPRQFGIPKA